MDEVVLLVPKSKTRWKLSVVVTLNQAETVISVAPARIPGGKVA
jgi:hypothetical protein